MNMISGPSPRSQLTASVPRRHMENLDLNSQADVFPNLDSYQEFLQAEDDGVNYPLPPRAPIGRGLGRGGARGGRRARSAGSTGG